MVFIDRSGTRKLPDASFLSMFKIVITTSARLAQEFRNGSYSSELLYNSKKKGRGAPRYSEFLSGGDETNACSLLKVKWLRLVIDEGHAMGKHQRSASVTFASWIPAERRWGMTGTPTKHGSAELTQIHALVSFLGHGFFTTRLDGINYWKTLTRMWSSGSLASFFRVRALLSFFMKRHTKLDIVELPPPHFSKVMVAMSQTESITYNTLVATIQSNILLTSMKGATSGFQDSLLNAQQSSNARKALANVRRTCVGYTQLIPTLSDKFWRETIYSAQELSLDEEQLNAVRMFLYRATTQQLSVCGCCGLDMVVLVLFPCCGGVACPECVDAESQECPICESIYSVDVLQRLQPGFVLEWLDNIKADKLEKEKKTAAIERPARVTPQQPMPNPDRANGMIIVRPNEERRRTHKHGDGHECEYDRYSVTGQCKLCKTEHDHCDFLNENMRCDVCHKVGKACSFDESKASYLCQTIAKLYRENRQQLAALIQSESLITGRMTTRPLKVIIFSQFRAALNVVGDRLLGRFGSARVAEYWGSFRRRELHRFVHDDECFVLLLGRDGSEGLDLSFTTNIFFLEEVWDKALLDQAVARAWRMGASGQVRVETLIAENTVEETMQAMNLDASSWSEQPANKRDREKTRTHQLLKSLRLKTEYMSFASSTKTGVYRPTGASTFLKRVSDDEPEVLETLSPPRKRPRVAFNLS